MSKEVKQPQGETVDELIDSYEKYRKGKSKKSKWKNRLTKAAPYIGMAIGGGVSGLVLYKAYNMGYNKGCDETSELSVIAYGVGATRFMGHEKNKEFCNYLNENAEDILKQANEIYRSRKHKK